MTLPLDYEMKLADNDLAFSNHHLVKSIPEEVFAPLYKAIVYPFYHPKNNVKNYFMWLYTIFF